MLSAHIFERTPDQGGRELYREGSEFPECITLYLHQVTWPASPTGQLYKIPGIAIVRISQLYPPGNPSTRETCSWSGDHADMRARLFDTDTEIVRIFTSGAAAARTARGGL